MIRTDLYPLKEMGDNPVEGFVFPFKCSVITLEKLKVNDSVITRLTLYDSSTGFMDGLSVVVEKYT